MLAVPLLSTLALAQAADVHGPIAPTPTGDPADPLLVWAPPTGTEGEWALTLGVQAIDDPAVLYRVEGGRVDELAVVGLAVGADVGVRWSPVGPVGLALTVPVFPVLVGDADGDGRHEAGPALGDARLAVPISLVARPDREGFGLGLVPYLELPTGASARFVGDPGPAAGLVAAAGVRGARLALDANAGLEAVARADLGAQVRGPLALPIGLSVGAKVAEPVWARIEARGTVDLLGGVDRAVAPGSVPALGAPFEVLATATARFGRPSGGTTAWIGAGRGLTHGIGAADLRVLGGGGYARLVIPDDAVAQPADPGATRIEAVLAWEPTEVAARVVDLEGRPLDATLAATSVDEPGRPPITGRPGGLALPPGRWRIALAAPGMGAQVRELVIEPTGRPPEPLEAVLLADQGGPAGARIVVTDPDGDPVEGARVLVDGLPVGTTAAGGLIALSGLPPGTHTLEVRHEAFVAPEPIEVALTEGTLAVPVPLQRAPGSVRVVVRGPDGAPVSDAVARFVGPRRLAPMALGEDGDRVRVLGPGVWTLIVTAEGYGVQEREVVVSEGRSGLVTAELVLRPSEGGEAELVLRVVGPDGRPVEGVQVALDGEPVGATSTGGALTLPGLLPGPRTLALRGQGLRPSAVPLTLAPGIQERIETVAWEEGTVDVVVRGPAGPVPDARVHFVGEGAVPPVTVGPDGRTRLTLSPGAWTARVTSEGFGAQERELVVPEGGDRLQVLDLVLAPVEGGLAALSVRVVDPDGGPVEGARVALDGDEVGTTANAGTVGLEQLTLGQREVSVAASPFLDAVDDLRLLEGPQELEIPLEWGVGAVRVRVHSADRPVADAVVRLLGADVRPPIPVDPETGEVLTQAPPGRWLVLARSPTLGIAEWDVDVEPEPALNQVALDLRPAPPDRTDLVVRVVDPDGKPVEGARVTLDGASAGDTRRGGVVLARGLVPGVIQARVEAPDHLAVGPLATELTPGLVERIVELRWVEVPVTVRALAPDGSPVDAVVQWVGPTDLDPLRTGPDGAIGATLRPGEWRVVASSADGALAADAGLTVRTGDEPAPIELVLEPARAVRVGEAIVLREGVRFDVDRATLRPESGPVLDAVARVLLAATDVVKVEVQGHTDTVGSVAVSQALSQARAEAVVGALVERGVPPEALVARGYGPTRPVDTQETEGGARDRVAFEIVERAPRQP